MKITFQVSIVVQFLFCVVLVCNAQNENGNVTNKQLKAMNNASSPPYVEISNNRQGHAYNILIVGNSLSYHSEAKNIGWNLANGMAASGPDKDYAHLLLRMTDSIMPDKRINLKITPFAKFERNFATYDLGDLDSLLTYRPDLIIIQIGENVLFTETNTPDLFKEKYMSLINYLRGDDHPLVICTTPFFPSVQKNIIIQQVALATNSFLIDLSHLVLLDEKNYAKNEDDYPGDKSVWKNDGIGVHPGDFGMKNIAQQIFLVINALYAMNGL